MHVKSRHRPVQGFTLIEMVVVVALLGLLALIAVGRYGKSYEKALRATMITDLRNVATAQELYHRVNLVYTTNLVVLNIDPSPQSTIHITQASGRGWAAWNEIDGSTENCEMYVGDATSALGIVNSSEKIGCKAP